MLFLDMAININLAGMREKLLELGVDTSRLDAQRACTRDKLTRKDRCDDRFRS
jgi:hypothetical protein